MAAICSSPQWRQHRYFDPDWEHEDEDEDDDEDDNSPEIFDSDDDDDGHEDDGDDVEVLLLNWYRCIESENALQKLLEKSIRSRRSESIECSKGIVIMCCLVALI